MILRLIKYCWLTICLLSSGIAGAQVVLPKVLGNNMVLQRNAPVPVWGTASPGEKVTVKFNKQTKTTL